jgi:hypothetical protein
MKSVNLVLWAAWVAAPSAAQTLRAGATAIVGGGTGSVPVAFDAGPRPLAALEFTLAVPAGKGIEPRIPTASAAMLSAGKSLACTGTWKKAGVEYRWKCVLSGGVSPIQSGLVASAAFTVSQGTRPGDYAVGLEKAKGAGADAKPVDIKTLSGKLTVR